MSQETTEDETGKILEHLNCSYETDPMAQQPFFDATEAIQQKGIRDERIINALKSITVNAQSASARKEASKTLDYLETLSGFVNDINSSSGGRRVGCLVVAIAPITTFFAIMIWYASATNCFLSTAETSGYCDNVFRSLGDGLGVIVITYMFLVIGVIVSTILGALAGWLLGRMRQTMSRRVIIIAEFAVGLVVGAVPFLMFAFGSS